jgi:hypothetical protein
MKKLASFLVFLAMVPAGAATLSAGEAKNHMGETATVCGTVASVFFAAGSRGTPTFVNLDKAYPNQVFTILIWGDDLPKFKENPMSWEGKKACATGAISTYKGIPEIVAKSQDQITVTPNQKADVPSSDRP